MDNGYRFIMAFFLIRKRSILLEEWLSKIGGGPSYPGFKSPPSYPQWKTPTVCLLFEGRSRCRNASCRDLSLRLWTSVIWKTWLFIFVNDDSNHVIITIRLTKHVIWPVDGMLATALVRVLTLNLGFFFFFKKSFFQFFCLKRPSHAIISHNLLSESPQTPTSS